MAARYAVPSEFVPGWTAALRTRFRSEAEFRRWMETPQAELDDMAPDKLARVGAWSRLLEVMERLPVEGE